MTCLFADTDIVSAVAWSPDGTLLTVSDDKTVCRWSADGDMQGSFPINVFGTNVSWFPKSGKQVRYCLSASLHYLCAF
jgi:WD40 repeat protein